MTWECKICGKHGFGSQDDLIVGSDIRERQRYLGDICDECLGKLLNFNEYEVKVTLKRRRVGER